MRVDRVDIDITNEDIAKGTKSNSARCAVAQAVARKIPEAHRISVTTTGGVRFTLNQQRYKYFTPRTIEDYIVKFDAGLPIEPFKLHLRDPQVEKTKPYVKRGTPAGRSGPARNYSHEPTRTYGGRRFLRTQLEEGEKEAVAGWLQEK